MLMEDSRGQSCDLSLNLVEIVKGPCFYIHEGVRWHNFFPVPLPFLRLAHCRHRALDNCMLYIQKMQFNPKEVTFWGFALMHLWMFSAMY